eukprot:823364-Pelagomonas_calceolata.AAC.8
MVKPQWHFVDIQTSIPSCRRLAGQARMLTAYRQAALANARWKREREQKSMHMHACKLAPHAFCTLRQLWRKSSSNASNKRGHSQATRAFQLSLKNWLLTHSP